MDKRITIAALVAIVFLQGCQLVSITIHQNAIMDKGDNSADDFTKSEAQVQPSDDTSIKITPKLQ